MQEQWKSKTFKNVVPMSLLQAQRISREYQDYYNYFRPHQGFESSEKFN